MNNNNNNNTLEDNRTIAFTSWYAAYTVLASLNSLMHGVGGILLYQTYKRRKTPQHLLLVNLSLTEFLRNLTRVIICIMFITEGGVTLPAVSLWTVYVTIITYLYFSAMFLITADRLVATLLNVRHKIVCTPGRTKLLILLSWCVVLVVTVTVSAYYHSVYGVLWMFADDTIHQTMVYRVIMVLTILYLISVVFCYILIFLKYTRSKRSISHSHLSSFQLFKKSKFYVSVLLITTFLLLQVIPYGILIIKGDHLHDVVKMVLNILSEISDTTDFLIYVFMYEPVYNLLRKHSNSFYVFITTGHRERLESNLSRLIESQLTMTFTVRFKETDV